MPTYRVPLENESDEESCDNGFGSIPAPLPLSRMLVGPTSPNTHPSDGTNKGKDRSHIRCLENSSAWASASTSTSASTSSTVRGARGIRGRQDGNAPPNTHVFIYQCSNPDSWEHQHGGAATLNTRVYRRLAFLGIFLAVLVQQLVAFASSQYGPPAPPWDHQQAEDDTIVSPWSDFFGHHGQQIQRSSMALVSSMYYLLRFYSRHLADEVRERIVEPVKDSMSPPPCALASSPEELASLTLHNFYRNDAGANDDTDATADSPAIVGSWQRRALQQAIDLFIQLTGKQPTDAMTSKIMVFVGSPHTGKRTLTRYLHRVLVSTSPQCSHEHTVSRCCAKSLLLLDSKDLSGTSLVERQKAWITRWILQHSNKYPKAAVVALQQADYLRPDVVKWLVNDFWPSHEVLRDRAVLIMHFETSPVTRHIFRALKQSNTEDDPAAAHSLDLELRHAVEPWFGSTHPYFIFPFAPLTPSDLQHILKRQIQNDEFLPNGIESLLVRDEALVYLTSEHHIEYLLWKRSFSDNNDNIGNNSALSSTRDLVFASEGALALHPNGKIWSSLRNNIMRCIGINQWTKSHTLVLHVYDGLLGLMSCDSSGVGRAADCTSSLAPVVCRFRL